MARVTSLVLFVAFFFAPAGTVFAEDEPAEATEGDATGDNSEEPASDAGLAAPVAVFSTQNPGEVLLIQSILDEEQIPYYFKGELFLGSGMYVTPSVLIVSEQDAPKVMETLHDVFCGAGKTTV